ncbi:hypothetical protein RRF57_001568 [Xylaria bambusicola]|uniref:Zn(2)-C6 fungal-type domain-containing protein n=1 Tax=Xylaria bambusicola TaxID=326684 RepID=A0AAN7Z1P3_9PEZI
MDPPTYGAHLIEPAFVRSAHYPTGRVLSSNMSPAAKRKQRTVSSCIPCYTKKQKCNRQYPCNHCTHRRRIEECIFSTHLHPSVSSQDTPDADPKATSAAVPMDVPSTSDDQGGVKARGSRQPTLAGCFGYFEGSQSNTLQLLRQFGVDESSLYRRHPSIELCTQELDAARSEIENMPARSILGFLVQYYFQEIHWMHQLVHPSSFLARFEAWWKLPPITRVLDVEFAILILEIGAYVSQFLPSPSYIADSIHGIPLAEIRLQCAKAAKVLGSICSQADHTGSVVRVQHMCFTALREQCEGNMKASWTSTVSAIRAAQMIGIDRGLQSSTSSFTRSCFEMEMRRQLFCNLYIMDLLHVTGDVDNNGAPGVFMERVLQFRLAQFWNRQADIPHSSKSYDPCVAEERYEKFCLEFLTQLPAPFALVPNKKWDQDVPGLSRQRQLLHIAVYNSICNNFRSLLLMKPAQVFALPKYQQELLYRQKKYLIHAALGMLDAVKVLHQLLGTTQTRLFPIVFHTFEAAILLWGLTFHVRDGQNGVHTPECGALHTTDTLWPSFTRPMGAPEATQTDTSHSRCVEAIQEAQDRLQRLAVFNSTAAAGAKALADLLCKQSEYPRSQSETASTQTPASTPTVFDTEILDQPINPPPSNLEFMSDSTIWPYGVANFDAEASLWPTPADGWPVAEPGQTNCWLGQLMS